MYCLRMKTGAGVLYSMSLLFQIIPTLCCSLTVLNMFNIINGMLFRKRTVLTISDEKRPAGKTDHIFYKELPKCIRICYNIYIRSFEGIDIT